MINQKDRNAWLLTILVIIVLFVVGDLVSHVFFTSPDDEYAFTSHGYAHTVSLVLDDIMPILILSGFIIAGIVFVLVKDSS